MFESVNVYEVNIWKYTKSVSTVICEQVPLGLTQTIHTISITVKVMLPHHRKKSRENKFCSETIFIEKRLTSHVRETECYMSQ